MRIAEFELIINGDGSIFHLHIRPEQLADRIIHVGDPGRVAMFFNPLFDEIVFEGSSREFVWVTGWYKGILMTALYSGIGTDNIDIIMTELDALANIDFNTREVKAEHRPLTIVRLGTCGAIPITNIDMEASFMKHMGWLPALPYSVFRKSISETHQFV